MDTVIDSERNAYRTVQIGNRIWMAENLRTAVPGIPHLFPGINGEVAPLGRLYQLFSQETGCLHDLSTLLPPGWCLPGDSEWSLLAEALRSDLELVAAFAPSYAGIVHWDGTTNDFNAKAWYWSQMLTGPDYDHTNFVCFERTCDGGVEITPRGEGNGTFALVRLVKAE